MALRPILGEPGRFVDTNTNEEYDISEMREDDKYDTVVFAAGIIPAGTQAIFFRDLAGKLEIDTNLVLGGRLSHGEEMIIDRVGLHVPTVSGNLELLPSDLKKVYEDSYFILRVNKLIYIEGPMVKFPSGYGVYGNSVAAGQGVISNGVPSTAAAARLSQTQLLTSDHEFIGQLLFPSRAWVTAAVIAVVDQQPTLATPAFVRGYLHGLIKAATSK